MMALAGRVPGRGEIVAGPGDFEFEMLDADPRRIKRVKIQPRAVAAPTRPCRARRRRGRSERQPKPAARPIHKKRAARR